MSPLDRAWKLGYSPDTSVFSALETLVIVALYKSTFTIPYHTVIIIIIISRTTRVGQYQKKHSPNQDGCEWVSVSSGTGLPGLSLCVCVCVFVCDWHTCWRFVLVCAGRSIVLLSQAAGDDSDIAVQSLCSKHAQLQAFCHWQAFLDRLIAVVGRNGMISLQIKVLSCLKCTISYFIHSFHLFICVRQLVP